MTIPSTLVPRPTSCITDEEFKQITDAAFSGAFWALPSELRLFAEDIAWDTIENVVRRIEKAAETHEAKPHNLGGYARQAARNRARRWAEKLSRLIDRSRPVASDDAGSDSVPEPSTSLGPDATADCHEACNTIENLLQAFLKIISTVEEPYRQVFERWCYDRMSAVHIAKVLRLTPACVRGRWYRCLKDLFPKLKAEFLAWDKAVDLFGSDALDDTRKFEGFLALLRIYVREGKHALASAIEAARSNVELPFAELTHPGASGTEEVKRHVGEVLMGREAYAAARNAVFSKFGGAGENRFHLELQSSIRRILRPQQPLTSREREQLEQTYSLSRDDEHEMGD